MHINDEAAYRMNERLRARCEGKIKCSKCGNDQWSNFLYVEAGTELMAGCKSCGEPLMGDQLPPMARLAKVTIYAKGDDGLSKLGSFTDRGTEPELRRKAMDLFWDDRLDSASQLPVVEFDDVEDEEDEDEVA